MRQLERSYANCTTMWFQFEICKRFWCLFGGRFSLSLNVFPRKYGATQVSYRCSIAYSLLVAWYQVVLDFMHCLELFEGSEKGSELPINTAIKGIRHLEYLMIIFILWRPEHCSLPQTRTRLCLFCIRTVTLLSAWTGSAPFRHGSGRQASSVIAHRTAVASLDFTAHRGPR